jgi:hypothetical protein
MRRVFLVFLFGVLAALAASGCGGDEGTSDPDPVDTAPAEAPAAIAKPEFVKQANAICAKTNQELIKTSEDFTKEKNLSESSQPTDAQLGELTNLVMPAINQQVEELRALGAPAGDEAEVDAILSAVEVAIEEGEQDPATIYGADGGAFARANRLAVAYGLEKCGE